MQIVRDVLTLSRCFQWKTGTPDCRIYLWRHTSCRFFAASVKPFDWLTEQVTDQFLRALLTFLILTSHSTYITLPHEGILCSVHVGSNYWCRQSVLWRPYKVILKVVLDTPTSLPKCIWCKYLKCSHPVVNSMVWTPILPKTIVGSMAARISPQPTRCFDVLHTSKHLKGRLGPVSVK